MHIQCTSPYSQESHAWPIYYLAIQRSVWRDIKFAFCFLFVCLYGWGYLNAGWCDRREILAQGRANNGDGNEVVWGLTAPGGRKKRQMKFSLLWESMGNFCILAVFDISATRARIHTKYYLCRDNVCRRAPSPCGIHRPLGGGGRGS